MSLDVYLEGEESDVECTCARCERLVTSRFYAGFSRIPNLEEG